MNCSSLGRLIPVFISVCILAGHFSCATAQVCLDYSTYLHWIGEADAPVSALGAATDGDHLFVADGQVGLLVYSLVDPDLPALIHIVTAAVQAQDVVIGGDYAFVAAGTAGLHIVNISDPSSAYLAGTVDTAGPAAAVFLRDDLALVAVEEAGLQMFDVSDAAAPLPIKTIDTPGTAYGVCAGRYYAFVADGVMGVQIIDLTDLEAEEPVAMVDTPGNAKDVVSNERRLYVADGGQGVSGIFRTPDYFYEGFWLFNNNGDDLVGQHPVTLVGNARFESVQDGESTIWGLFTGDSSSHGEYAPAIEGIMEGRISFSFRLDASFASDPSFDGSIDFITSDGPGINTGDLKVGLDPLDGRLVFAQEDPDISASRELRSNWSTWDQDVWYEVRITWDDVGRQIYYSWSDSLGTYSDSQSDGFVSPCFADTAVTTLVGSRSPNAPTMGLVIDWLKVEDSVPSGRVETTTQLEGYAQDLKFQDDHAFVALEYGDLQVIDFSQPSLPVIVGTVDTPDRSRALALTADHAYLADAESGIQVIGCTNPASPVPLGQWKSPGSPYGVAVAGNHAFVADREFGLQVVDLTVPESPQPLAQVETAGHAMDVAVSGNHVYVAEAVFSGLAGKSFSPSFLSAALFPRNFSSDAVDKAGRYSSLQIIDVTDPSSPVVTGTVETPGYALDVEVVGGFSYVADFTSFLVIDTSFPDAPVIVGSLETPGVPRDLAVRGSQAFVANLQGLVVVDISLPAAPQLVGALDIPGSAYGVAVSGNTAYLADVVTGLHVIDVTNPASPQLVGTLKLPGGAYDVEVIGNFAYVSDGFDTSFSSLQIVDISAPDNPVLVGNLDTAGSVYSVAFEGDHVFVTDGVNGLGILERQCDPGFVETPGVSYPADFSLSKDQGGITFTWNPVPEGDLEAFRLVGVCGDSEWEIPFENDGAGRLVAFDEADEEFRGELVVYSLYLRKADDDWELIAEEEVLLEIPPAATRLVGARPNPFNPQTTVAFAVDRPQQVKLMVFDMAGRLVSTLADRMYEAGYHTEKWTGKNSSGQDVSSGIYFLWMNTDTASEVRKLTLVR